jgi:hypothetical protein
LGKLPCFGTIGTKLTSSERIRGIVVRRSTVIIALRYKVLAYRLGGQDNSSSSRDAKGKSKATQGFYLDKIGEWETAENENGESSSVSTSASVANGGWLTRRSGRSRNFPRINIASHARSSSRTCSAGLLISMSTTGYRLDKPQSTSIPITYHSRSYTPFVYSGLYCEWISCAYDIRKGYATSSLGYE